MDLRFPGHRDPRLGPSWADLQEEGRAAAGVMVSLSIEALQRVSFAGNIRAAGCVHRMRAGTQAESLFCGKTA